MAAISSTQALAPMIKDSSFEMTGFSSDSVTQELIRVAGKDLLTPYIENIWRSTITENEIINRLEDLLKAHPNATKMQFNGVIKRYTPEGFELSHQCATINLLHLACFSLKKDVAVYLHTKDRALIRAGGDRSAFGQTPVAYLAQHQNPVATKIFQDLLKAAPFALAYSKLIPNPSPIHEIAQAGNFEMMNITLEHLYVPHLPKDLYPLFLSYIPKAVDSLHASAPGLRASTPLRLAVRNGDFLEEPSRQQLIALLLEAGANPYQEFDVPIKNQPSQKIRLIDEDSMRITTSLKMNPMDGSTEVVIKREEVPSKKAEVLKKLVAEYSPHYRASPAQTK